jgi:polyisoprenoid-binding protein YceI
MLTNVYCKALNILQSISKTNVMKKIILCITVAAMPTLLVSAQTKYITRTGQANIYSHTVAEDISATNNTVTGIINAETGDIAISVPVQSFQFEKALMQEHFNQPNFMDSKQFPKISLKGKITNLSAIDLSKNGKYEATVSGDLTIKGVTKPVTEKATIEVNNGKVSVTSKFLVKDIGSFGVGKPMGKKKNNVADDIEVNYTAAYEKSDE